MKISIHQSYYKTEQLRYLSDHAVPYDNTANLNPDVREYPQMKRVHDLARGDNDAYGLISWKFADKTRIQPEKFMNWILDNPNYDFWFINPCQILESVCLTPWEQGEWWHPGISKLGKDAIHSYHKSCGIRSPMYEHPTVFPRDKMFFANYFVARPEVWDRLFSFTDRIYECIDRDPDLKRRMMSASGYAGDPGMSHFIFLFERFVPTFLMINYDIRSVGYPYKFEEVSDKFNIEEWNHVQVMSDLKKIMYPFSSQELLDAHSLCREDFVKQYPYSIAKE